MSQDLVTIDESQLAAGFAAMDNEKEYTFEDVSSEYWKPTMLEEGESIKVCITGIVPFNKDNGEVDPEGGVSFIN